MEASGVWARTRRIFKASGTVVRLAKRDPHHIAERLTLLSVDRQADPARAWAQRALATAPDASPALLADDLRRRTIGVARIDGAIAGTPFFIALVPAYVTYLQQESRLMFRTAALYGHDPANPEVAADFLVLRGVHPDAETAHAELEKVRRTELPPEGERTPLKSWYQAILRILILAGFIGPPEEGDDVPLTRGQKTMRVVRFLIAAAIWAMTWIIPITFMIVMSWACESDARRFGQRVLTHYGSEEDDLAVAIARADRKAGGNRMLGVARGALVFVSVALPLLLLGVTILNGSGPLGVKLPTAAGALAGLALVIGVAVAAARG